MIINDFMLVRIAIAYGIESPTTIGFMTVMETHNQQLIEDTYKKLMNL